MNQGTITGLPAETPIKRKRGRPRKDDSHAPSRTPVPSIEGEGSGAVKSTATVPSKGKKKVSAEDVDNDDQNNDEMVGQVVTGILEYAFDAGYFLTVRTGDSNVCMRGVVFKEDCIVPVTPENDIAPNAKMHKRREFPIPAMNFSPQVAAQTPRNSSLNPTENFKIQQQKLPSPNVSQENLNLLQKEQSDDKEQQEKSSHDKEQQKLSDKESQEKVSDYKEQQEKVSDDKEQQEKLSDDKEQQEKLLVGDGIIEEDFVEMEGLKHSPEPPMKLQKTDQMTVSLSNGEEIVQHNVLTAENSQDAVKSVEAANNTVLSREAIFNPPEITLSVRDSPVDVPTGMEQEIGRTSGFQISMENPDDEDELSEPPSDVSPMKTD